jgi:hypothetical protein
MATNTSVGRGPASGGNENHDGDPRNTTLGETVKQEPPAGNEVADEGAAELPGDSPIDTGKDQ